MEAALVAEVIAALLGGAAGEMGKSAWSSLTALVRRRFGAGGDDLAVLEGARAADTERVVGVLRRRAETDAEFAVELAAWAGETRDALRLSTTNVISGNATVHGNIVQTGHITGSITFGR